MPAIGKETDIALIEVSGSGKSAELERFLKRPSIEESPLKTASGMLDDIRQKGDKAVLDYARKIDGLTSTTKGLRVTEAEFKAARESVDAEFKRAARKVLSNVSRFARAGRRKDWNMSTAGGGILGERFVPLKRVGVYVPGGAAPLVSTVLMTVPIAKVAGVKEIVACSPSAADGTMNPYMLYALELAGATEVYRIGGVQSIGAMAYGTKTISKVQKIVGPGGPYVTAAKKLVYGDVSLDMVAGPSEIAVLADTSASPVHIAADLLSQAEHGTGSEKSLLVCTSKALAGKVRKELVTQAQSLSRKAPIWEVLKRGTMLVVVKNLDIGMALCNRFAPEHFELLVRSPRKWLKKVEAAGAVFLGPWTPEVAGDFAAGPSHVLPTGGAAAMFSGLSVDDFLTRTSVIGLKKTDLKSAMPVIRAFSRVEGLDAHGRSAEVRFE